MRQLFKNKHANIMLILSALLIVILAIPAYIWSQSNVKEMDKFYNSKLSPVIMIPGSSATVNRFDGMVSEINKKSPKPHSLVKVKVWNNGRMTVSGVINKGDNEPFIVVGFENNRDGYKNIKKESHMFNTAFTMLQNKYEFNNYKAIGHSNGGLVYTSFLEKYAAEYPEVRLKKLLTMGTPYNFEETNNHHRTQMLSDFIRNKDKIPKNMTMYTLAGTQTYTSDGIVPEESVRAAKYIYQDRVKDFTEITVTGSKAEHSDLPENKEAISIITQRILDKPHGPDVPSNSEKGN